MLHFAVTPPWVYVMLLLTLAGWLVSSAIRQKPEGHPQILRALLVFALLQIAVAGMSLTFTALRSIDHRACLAGFLGFWGNILVFGAEIGLLVLLFLVSRERTRRDLATHGSFFAALLLTTVVATVIHVRSALLCTV